MHNPSSTAGRQSLADARLRRHSDYQRAYAAARKHQSSSMSWFLAPRAADDFAAGQPGRVGLTAGKVLGKAHERNRIKRRMREALRRHVALLPAGMDLILHPRRIVMTLDFRKLEAEIVRILTQAGAEARRMRERGAGMNAAPGTEPAPVSGAGPGAIPGMDRAATETPARQL